jgi:hypothetical protein
MVAWLGHPHLTHLCLIPLLRPKLMMMVMKKMKKVEKRKMMMMMTKGGGGREVIKVSRLTYS